MKRYLLVAHRTQGSPQLLSHVASLARNEPGSEFAILVPATPKSYWHAWDEFEAQDRAMRIADRATAALRDVGANVFRSSVGSREPLLAIEDELRQGPEYDEIIICTLSPGVSHWLKRDLVNQARKHTGLPVTHVVGEPVDEGGLEVEAAPAGRQQR